MHDGFHRSVEAEFARYPNDSYGVIQCRLNVKTRNRPGQNTFKVHPYQAMCFTPGLSKDFWNATMNVSVGLRVDFSLYGAMFQRHFPNIVPIPFITGGELRHYSRWRDPKGYIVYIQDAIRNKVSHRLGRALSFTWQESTFVDQVLAKIEPDDPSVDANSLRDLQQADRRRDNVTRMARHLLFYRQVNAWLSRGRGALIRGLDPVEPG